MNSFKERLEFAGFTALVGFIISMCYVAGSTIILIRMNSQACVPEVNLWDFYKVNQQILRVLVFFLGGFVGSFILDLFDRLNINTWNSPKWLKNLGKFIWFVLLIGSAIILTVAAIYHLFIKSPC